MADELMDTGAEVVAGEVDSSADAVADAEVKTDEQTVETQVESKQEQTVQQPSKSHDRISRLIEQRKKAEAERDEALAKLTAPAQEESAKYTPPSKFEIDSGENDGLQEYKGMMLTPDIVKTLQSLEETNKTLSQKFADQERARQEAESNAKVEKAQAELVKEVTADIQAQRAKALPGLKPEQAEKVDRQLFMLTDHHIGQAMQQGAQYTPELIEAATKSALDDLKETFGIFSAAQMQDNQEHAETYKTLKPGTPGIKPPKPLDQMTKQERERYIDQCTKAAEAMRQSA